MRRYNVRRFYEQIGWTRVGYRELPVVVHPDDIKTELMLGDLGIPWQGVQLNNPAVDVATHFSNISNPYFLGFVQQSRLQYDTGAAMQAFPGTVVVQEQRKKSAMDVVRRRLRGS